MGMNKLAQKLQSLPHNPGCYFFYDNAGRVLYVGKAKNLKKRVSSYFVKKDKDSKTQVLVSKITDIRWEITDSEMEALILESQLIKKFLPPYNIKIKDDKSFLWVKIDFNQKYPRPELTRNHAEKKMRAESRGRVKIFGPFTDATLLRAGMTVLRRIFQWCELSENEIARHQKMRRPCFSYHIKNCSGICGGLVNNNDYQKGLKGLAMFFEGKKGNLVKNLQREMTVLAKNREFEKAGVLRDKVKALENIGKVLKITNDKFPAYNALHSNAGRQIINKFQSSNGQIIRSIIRIINSELGCDLKFKKDFRIEFYDISNMSGTNATASMTVWQDGEFTRDQYRKFKIKTVKGSNDVKMMREVLARRMTRSFHKSQITNYKSQTNPNLQSSNPKLNARCLTLNATVWPMPDLIILDGGKPQLGEIWHLFNELRVNIPLVSLAKKEEKVFGINQGRFRETSIEKNSDIGYFLQRIRDEAHRFAITFHRQLRAKKAIKSRLDEISGIGPKTKKKLLLRFGTVTDILGASPKDLAKIVGEKLATRIRES